MTDKTALDFAVKLHKLAIIAAEGVSDDELIAAVKDSQISDFVRDYVERELKRRNIKTEE